MLRLLDTRNSPPGGFLFTQSETGWNSRKECPETQWNFRLLCRKLAEHRSHHPQLRLTTDLELIAMEVDCVNARRVSAIDGGWVHVRHEGPPTLISRVFRPGSHPRGTITMRRSMALGDVLAATCVAKKLAEEGFGVVFQCIPDCQPIVARVPYIQAAETVGGKVDIDLDGAYENHSGRRTTSFYDIFTAAANSQLEKRGVRLPLTNMAPKMVVEDGERYQFSKSFTNYPHPWVMVCPKSNSWNHRTVPRPIWEEAAKTMAGTKFWIGMDPAPPGYVDCGLRHFDEVIRAIACADVLCTVDTGPMHVAAALNVPVVAIQQSSSPEMHLSDQQDFIMISPPLDCLNCQQAVCPINAHTPPCQNIPVELIVDAVNKRCQSATHYQVSAIIPIFKPDAFRLNRCLQAVLPQVEEVIVTMELGGLVPMGAMSHEKIRYVRKNESNIGLGRNINYGARHANHQWLLILNDDVFLEPDAVSKMLKVTGPKVGMVAHLLRYPDGTIQHGGTRRTPGQMGWHHIDHRRINPEINQVTEMENVTGASILVRRKAFYEAGCFDEDIKFYTEDNCLCLQIRQAGWKIIYTPHACGIHEEHQSTKSIANISAIISESCRILEQKWGWYFTKNSNNSLGTFD